MESRLTGAGPATAVGVLPDHTAARQTVESLLGAGIRPDQIGVIGPDQLDPERRAERSGLPNDPTYSRWEEGAGIGAAVGGATGLGLGLAVAAGVIPVIGPVVAGGTLVALLASAGGGATAGTVLGALLGLSIPEDEARWYESELAAGHTLVVVHGAGDRVDEVRAILHRHGATLRTAPDDPRPFGVAMPGNSDGAPPYGV